MKLDESSWGLLKTVLVDHLDTGRLDYTQHAIERMRERNIPRNVVEAILRSGAPSELHDIGKYPHGPNPNSNQHPVLTFVGNYKGEKIAVGMSIHLIRGRTLSAEFVVRTVFALSLLSRHNRA